MVKSILTFYRQIEFWHIKYLIHNKINEKIMLIYLISLFQNKFK